MSSWGPGPARRVAWVDADPRIQVNRVARIRACIIDWIVSLCRAMTRDVASICLSCNAHKRELAFLYCHRVGVQQPMATTFCQRVGAQHQWRLPLVIASHRRWRGDPVIIESRIRADIIYWIASLRSQ